MKRVRRQVEEGLDLAGSSSAPVGGKLRFPAQSGSVESAAVRLLAVGVIVRPIQLPEAAYLRVTIGRAADNDRLFEHIASAVSAS
jgi:histidinol-phosphate/aromatic aminotransferase/cobyric acid decarboxylase-like protein